jgi:hypothetical protein
VLVTKLPPKPVTRMGEAGGEGTDTDDDKDAGADGGGEGGNEPVGEVARRMVQFRELRRDSRRRVIIVSQ